MLFDAEFYSGKCELAKIYQDKKDLDYICLTRGPIVLAADSSLGKLADSAFNIDESKLIDAKIYSDNQHIINCNFEDANGEKITLVDYGSAGRDWKTMIAAWLPTK